MERVEPWLRGTLREVDAVRRQVLHALLLAGEDVEHWCGFLSDDEMEARPFAIAPVGFHLRHIARSLDRLLTYAEGLELSAAQLSELRAELDGGTSAAEVMEEFRRGLARTTERVRELDPRTLEEARSVGRDRLPTTVGGLLVHCADHTQRHVGQAVTTAKIVIGMRSPNQAFGSNREVRD